MLNGSMGSTMHDHDHGFVLTATVLLTFIKAADILSVLQPPVANAEP